MTTPVAAAVAVARQHGIRVEEPVLLHDSFNLRIHLRPAPVVARVPTVTAMGRERPDEVLRRELEVVSHLHRAGAPVVPPSGLLPPGPHLRDGFVVTFWTYAEHDPERVISPEEAGRGLAGLHEALRGFPGELPTLWPALDEPARLLGVLDGRIDPGAHARLRAGHEELAGRRCARTAWTPTIPRSRSSARRGRCRARCGSSYGPSASPATRRRPSVR
ncbi:hypothetical protein ACWEPN_03870 [Nonomuraea wenchangensis]